MRIVTFLLLCQTVVVAQEPVAPATAQNPGSHAAGFVGEPQITVEVRFVSISPEELSKLSIPGRMETVSPKTRAEVPTVSVEDLRRRNGIQLVSSRKVTTQQQPVVIQRLNESQTKQLIRQAQQCEQSNIMFAPKVTLFNRQTAEIGDAVERPFVTRLGDKQDGVQPLIEFYKEGTMLQLRTTVREDGIQLDTAVDFADIRQVFEKPVGPSGEKIQVPEVESSQVALSAIVGKGETLVISGVQRTTEHRYERRRMMLFKDVGLARRTEEILLLLTPRIVQPDTVANAR